MVSQCSEREGWALRTTRHVFLTIRGGGCIEEHGRERERTFISRFPFVIHSSGYSH